MSFYDKMKVYFGDLHSHCNISYGCGSLESALKNAKEQLDFCSVTGHAYWPDMPEPNARIQYIIDFHREGFERLRKNWFQTIATLKKTNKEGKFIVFPGFEVHFNSVGDRTIIYKNLDGEIVYADNHEQLCQQLRQLKAKGKDSICFPHHIGYRKGARGIDWTKMENDLAPFVEIVSMHGCSETNENTRPFLHSMGPSDWEGTAQYGLARGNIFGFIGNTDHHSAHPGSYGHGLTGVWAQDLTREALWEAFYARRVYALTGDRISLEFLVNGNPMGALIPRSPTRKIEFGVIAGGAIDYIDIVKNNKTLKRFSSCDFSPTILNGKLKSKFYIELGWGEKTKSTKWDIDLAVSEGFIEKVEPRFRGREVVSPIEQKTEENGYCNSHWEKTSDKKVHFTTLSEGNPNNFTNTTQGVLLEIDVPLTADIEAVINGKKEIISVQRLLMGAKSGNLGLIDSPAYRLSRLPLPSELNWKYEFIDTTALADDVNFYYLRVKQNNDQWAWSSPIFISN